MARERKLRPDTRPATAGLVAVLALILGAAAVGATAFLLGGRSHNVAGPVPSFLTHQLGARAAAPSVHPHGLDASIDRSGLRLRLGSSAVRLSASAAGRARWQIHESGAVRPTSFGHELVVLGHTGVEEYLTVTRHQGVRTWRWRLGANLDPSLSFGMVMLKARDGSGSAIVEPPAILDGTGNRVTPRGLHWTVSRHAGVSWLELRLDDRQLPLPYVIDPAVSSVTFSAPLQVGGYTETWTVGMTVTSALASAGSIYARFTSGFNLSSVTTGSIALGAGFTNCSVASIVSNAAPLLRFSLGNSGGTCAVVAGATISFTVAGVVNDVAGTYTANTSTNGSAIFNARTSADTTTVADSAGSEVLVAPPTKLVVKTIAPASPTAGAAFNVTVESQDGTSTARPMATATNFTLSLVGGTGTLGGTLTGTIPQGSSSFTVVGATYTKAESIVSLKATQTSGTPAGLTAPTSATFTVIPAAASTFTISDAGAGTASAGSADQLTITAYDAYGNLATGYAGAKALTFSGGTNSPNATVPTVTDNTTAAVNFGTATTITFTAGVSSSGGAMKLYNATPPAQTITATAGAITTPAGLAMTVNPLAANTFTISDAGAGSASAGSADQLTITAKDLYGNTATGYAGAKALTFSGGTNSPNATVPTVTDNTTAAVNFGTATTITFTAGVSSSGGAMKLYNATPPAQSITAIAGAITTPAGLAMTVNPLAANTFTISDAGAGTASAGSADQLTITAKDLYGNTATGYAGAKALTFSGGTNSPNATVPTVTDNTTAAVNFGTATTITFTAGVSSSGGAMKLYNATPPAQSITAIAGAITTPAGLAMTVNPLAANTFTISDAGAGTASAGSADQLTITAKDLYGNTATGYAGAKALTFSGGTNSPNATVPTVTDNTTAAVNFGTATTITFTAGVSSSGGAMKLYNATPPAQSITAIAGAITTPAGLAMTVNPLAANTFTISDAGAGTASAGSADQLTITAKDLYGNTATGYAGAKALTFSGGTNSPNATVP